MFLFFFQAEDGIRDAQESRGLGDVYKRQADLLSCVMAAAKAGALWVTLQAHPNVVAVASLLLSLIHI